ncbi:MAG: rod shape-determining protein RodA [Polyangiaceae bacterium]|nr:rod shape-determining protein RodA [Polyangiaceae bacterium]
MPRGSDGLSSRSGVQIDWALMTGVVAVATMGVVNLYSATSPYIGAGARAGLADVYVSQIYWLVVGMLAGILVAAIDYRQYERLAYPLYAAGILSLCLVFVLGADTRGARRWIELGGFTFQPSEFMKVILVLVLAKFLHDDPKTEPRTLIDLLPAVVFTLVPVALVMVQPDLGTSLIYLSTAMTMISMSKIRPRAVITLAGLGSAAAFLLWSYGMHGYQRDRITSFLDPEADKTGTGWHALQSRIAIGNGGLWGEGFMQGTQNQFGFLPDQFSDFPLAVFAEDWGLLGGLVLLGTYAFLCIWAINVASQAKDRFGAGVSVGVGSIVFWHTLANAGMAMGILPVVGITLPLFSYGGSSLVTSLIAFGLLMGVSMRR